MNHRLIRLSGIALASLSMMTTAQGEVVDAIAATVGEEVILYSEVMGQIQPAIEELRRTSPDSDTFNERAEKLVLDTLEEAIEAKILLREALLLGIEVTEDDVDSAMDEARRQFESNDEFVVALETAGETVSDFRERQRKRLLSGTAYRRKVFDLERQVIVTEEDIAKFYNDHHADFERPEEVLVRQIFLIARTDEDRAKARERMAIVRGEIDAGADFGDLAKAHSQAPDAEVGGEIGWVQRGDLVEALETAAFATTPGQTSPVLETPNGVHLIKVEDHRDPGQRTLDEVRVEIEPAIRSQQAQIRYDTWMAELRKRSRVRVFL